MKLIGRRIHIVGSSDAEVDERKLAYAHSLVSELVSILAAEGASFVVPFGKEPFLKGRTDGQSIVFDWTVAEAIGRAIEGGAPQPTCPAGRLIATIATSKTDSHIPASRRPLYEMLREKNAVSMEFVEPGWSAGAYRRNRLAEMGDVMIGISGGEGVEHQALVYSAKGKPVIPLDIGLGSSQRDGSGGAARLFDRALSTPDDFFRVTDGHSPAELLDRTRTRDGESAVDVVVDGLIRLLHALESPQVFYVRLLNTGCAEFPSVENFFRETIDPLVESLGFEHFEMGTDKHEFAWMNEAIFSKLHHSAVVLVDLTALRPNCFMELGYAFGNRQRVIVTARGDTKIPFDAQSLEAFTWSETEPLNDRERRLREHWQRNIDRPGIVSVRKAQ